MAEDYYTRGEKEFLLKIARSALEQFSAGQERFEPKTVNQKLWEKRLVLASLGEGNGQQFISPWPRHEEALILAARDQTLAAARLAGPAVWSNGRLPKIKITLAILSEVVETMFEEVTPGDGVAALSGEQNAVFLPSAWTRWPKKDSFLAALQQVLGQEASAAVKYYKFQAVAFTEGEI